ncbi:hypothetical protein EK0264_16805 [Epidermidibacterium keratini]|uniref:Uncharacterized protein n=1 Tax=Epidermidibacterium keratini TaxID=1891644 RepID=A0A7L4YRK9_9ACTN|nr:hypothetical protein [Epidermidibacterium keratini]QHC01776.1 hypothetical protein EK0264_16805 [Epidermidibacterium keratini]
MLVLTHGSPGSPAVQQLFVVLHDLGLGRSRLGGLTVLGDGFERLGPIRGLAFLPAGLAVLAAHEVQGAQGYLYAPQRGSWTVGGQVANLGGAGSSPVAELDSAVKALVARVRRGGVDPGNVQALVGITGAVSGVAQPEPERGAGLVVTALSPDEVVEALQTATRPTYGGLSQTWTTADVRAVLEILGYRAEDIDTEQLSAEGFPYSPYVLRPTSTDDIPFSRDEPASLPGGGRGLRSYEQPHPPRDARSTGPVPAVTPPVPGTRGAPALVGVAAPADPANPGDLLREPDAAPEQRGSAVRWIVPLVLLAVVAAAIVIGGRALFAGGTEDGANDGAGATTSATGSPTPSQTAPPSATQQIGDLSFTQGAYEKTTDCASFAFGEIADLLAATPCTQMERGLFLTQVEGKNVVVTLAVVTMPDAGSAATLKSRADSDGTGNVNDLLRDGTVPPGYPQDSGVLGDGEYASSVEGKVVRIVQAAFVDGSKTTDAVDAAADAALGLELVA